MVLAFNFVALMKKLILPDSLKKRMKRLRFHILNIAEGVITRPQDHCESESSHPRVGTYSKYPENSFSLSCSFLLLSMTNYIMAAFSC